jgi:hypothetical protein
MQSLTTLRVSALAPFFSRWASAFSQRSAHLLHSVAQLACAPASAIFDELVSAANAVAGENIAKATAKAAVKYKLFIAILLIE